MLVKLLFQVQIVVEMAVIVYLVHTLLPLGAPLILGLLVVHQVHLAGLKLILTLLAQTAATAVNYQPLILIPSQMLVATTMHELLWAEPLEQTVVVLGVLGVLALGAAAVERTLLEMAALGALEGFPLEVLVVVELLELDLHPAQVVLVGQAMWRFTHGKNICGH
jgi:hypothetical protein